MSLGKFKDAWPIWLLIVGAFVFIGYSLWQQPASQEDVVSIQEIFPDDDISYRAPVETLEATGLPSPPAEVPIVRGSQTATPQTTQPVPQAQPLRTTNVAPAPAQAQAQTPTAVTPAPATGEYTVQVFSFKDKEDADASAAQMKEKGYPAYVLTSNLGDKGTWHRVRIGSYATQAQATEMLKRVQGDYKNGFVVKVTKD